MTGWDVRVLSSSYSSKDDEAVIELYGKTRDRESIVILARGFHPYFFIVDPLPDMATQFRKDPDVVDAEEIPLLVKGSIHNTLKVTIKYPWKMGDYTNRLKSRFRLLGTDITFQDRFIYDNDLGACIHVEGRVIESEDYVTDLVVEMGSAVTIESFDPGLKILSFDIENSVRHDFLYTICTVIKDGNGDIRNCECAVGSETEIIERFTGVILREDPDVITGYNIDNYDIKKIVERAKINRIGASLTWGRDRGTPRIVSDRFWRVKGRLVVDAWWAARREYFWLW